MTKNRLTPVFFTISFAASVFLICSTLNASSTPSKETGIDLVQILKQVETIKENSTRLTPENCGAELAWDRSFFDNWMPVAAETERLRKEGPEILASFFQSRMALRAQLDRLPKSCAESMRWVFVSMRAIEDAIGVVAYQDPQISADLFDFSKQPVPLFDADKYHPYQKNGSGHLFQKGDIMITKGVSVISSTISGFPIESSLFSHTVFIYQNPKGELGTLESYIGKGVDMYPMTVALQNENARILILRPIDQATAIKAHDYMYGRVEASYRNKQKIPYDYIQDFNENSRLSCEEIAYDAYKTVTLDRSEGAFEIPWVQSVIALKDQALVTNAGLRNGSIMMPGDMEVDPRFEVVADWTDYRLIRDSWRKDAILKEFFRWINEEDYSLHGTLKSSIAKLIWKTRNNKFLWPTLSKLAGIPEDFEKEVPANGIALIANLKIYGSKILPKLAELDEAHYAATGEWMSRRELREQVNQLRLLDLERNRSGETTDFHWFLYPNHY